MKIKIDWTEFELSFPEEISHEDGKTFAEFAYDQRIIRVENRLPENQKAHEILHELVHAVTYFRGIGLSEDQVRGLSHGLTTVLKENGPLQVLLFEKLAGEA